MLAEIGLHGSNTNCSHALHLAVFAEEPKSKVDVVDRAVDEDTTGEFSVGNEEPTGVELVAGLRAEDRWSTDVTVDGATVSIAIGGIEATGETADDFLVGEFLDRGIIGVDDGLRLS